MRNQRTVLITACSTGLILALLVLVAFLDQRQNDEPKDFSVFGCSYATTAINSGHPLQGADRRWYRQNC